MINVQQAKRFCKEDFSKIENYDKAIADTMQIWHIHHRDEIRVLPSGMIAIRSVQELIENGRYCHCPANELIFLTPLDHKRLHNKYMSKEVRQKLSVALKLRPHPMLGKTHSEQTKRKMSEAKKGKLFSEEHKAKIREAKLGKKRKPFSEETKTKMSEAHKKYWESRRRLSANLI